MTLPDLWTRRRLLQLAGLACIGILQASAALAVGFLGSRVLTVEGRFDNPYLPAGVVAAMMLLISSRILQRRYAERFALGYVAELRSAFMSHVIRTPVDARHVGNGLVMTRMVNDMSAIKLWLSSGLVSIVVAAAVMVSVAIMLAGLVPGMAVTIAAAFLLWCVPVAICLKPLEQRIRASRRYRGRIASRAGAVLAARATLLGFGRHGSAIRRFSRLSRRLNAALVARATMSGLLRSSGDVIFPAVVLITYGKSVWVSGAPLDAVSLGVLIMMTGLTATHLSAVALGLEYRLAHRVALSRLQTVLQRPAIDHNTGKKLPRRDGARSLSVDGVPVGSYHRLVSFTVKSGEWAWLPDITEAEADDLLMKVARLKHMDAGRIEIDSYSATESRARNWWREVTIVSPRLALFRASVRDNATLGANSKADEEERHRILQAFGLTEKVATTAIGEDGPPAGVCSHAVRAARAVLRHSAVVLVADAELVADKHLFGVFLEELKAADTTIVVTGDLPENWRSRFRRVDLPGASAA